MKESYEQGLASHSALTPTLATVTLRVLHGEGVHAGQPLSSEIRFSRADLVSSWGRQYGQRRQRRVDARRGGVTDPVHAWKLQAREPGDPAGFPRSQAACSPIAGSIRERHRR